MNIFKKTRGFTLIELVIAVMVIGTLAAIALPLYQNHISQARRADATTLLLHVATQQGQFFLDNKTYAANLASLGYSTATTTTENGHYTVRVQAATAACPIQTCFTLQAIPQSTHSADSCGTLTLDSQGNKLPATSGCWKR